MSKPIIAICYEPPAADSGVDMQDILVQAEFLQANLPYQAKLAPYTGDVVAFLDSLKGVDVAWNLFETFNGREELQYLGAALLDIARVPYTGTKAEALAHCADKRIVSAILAAAGINVPQIISVGALLALSNDLATQWIVKPAKMHGSVGIGEHSIWTGEAVYNSILNCENFWVDMFAERYIDGDEYSVTLLPCCDEKGLLLENDLEAVTVAQMQFINYPPDKPHILGYDAKWNEDSSDYAQTVRSFDVDTILASRLALIAEDAAKALGLAGFARIDFRVSTEQEIIYVIDVNPNPGLGEDSGFIAACIQAGMSVKDCLTMIVEAAYPLR